MPGSGDGSPAPAACFPAKHVTAAISFSSCSPSSPPLSLGLLVAAHGPRMSQQLRGGCVRRRSVHPPEAGRKTATVGKPCALSTSGRAKQKQSEASECESGVEKRSARPGLGKPGNRLESFPFGLNCSLSGMITFPTPGVYGRPDKS